MSKEVSVEFGDDGEVVVKHNGSAEALSTVEAIARAVALMSKNDDSYSDAYTPPEGDRDPDAADDDNEEDDDEIEAGEPAARSTGAQLRRSPAALAAALVGERVSEKRSETVSNNIDEAIATIRKAGNAISVCKRVIDGRAEYSEHDLTKILTEAWGAKQFVARLTAQDDEGLAAREALQTCKGHRLSARV